MCLGNFIRGMRGMFPFIQLICFFLLVASQDSMTFFDRIIHQYRNCSEICEQPNLFTDLCNSLCPGYVPLPRTTVTGIANTEVDQEDGWRWYYMFLAIWLGGMTIALVIACRFIYANRQRLPVPIKRILKQLKFPVQEIGNQTNVNEERTLIEVDVTTPRNGIAQQDHTTPENSTGGERQSLLTEQQLTNAVSWGANDIRDSGEDSPLVSPAQPLPNGSVPDALAGERPFQHLHVVDYRTNPDIDHSDDGDEANNAIGNSNVQGLETCSPNLPRRSVPHIRFSDSTTPDDGKQNSNEAVELTEIKSSKPDAIAQTLNLERTGTANAQSDDCTSINVNDNAVSDDLYQTVVPTLRLPHSPPK